MSNPYDFSGINWNNWAVNSDLESIRGGLSNFPATKLNNGVTDAPAGIDWGKWLGSDKQAGIVPVAANLGAGLMQGWAGLQQMKLAKRAQKFQEGMALTNLANQATLVNKENQAKAEKLYRMNPTKYQNPAQYMEKWAVKGTI